MHLQTILYKYNNKYFKHIFDEHQQTQRDDQNKDRKYFRPPRKSNTIQHGYYQLFLAMLCYKLIVPGKEFYYS